MHSFPPHPLQLLFVPLPMGDMFLFCPLAYFIFPAFLCICSAECPLLLPPNCLMITPNSRRSRSKGEMKHRCWGGGSGELVRWTAIWRRRIVLFDAAGLCCVAPRACVVSRFSLPPFESFVPRQFHSVPLVFYHSLYPPPFPRQQNEFFHTNAFISLLFQKSQKIPPSNICSF